MKNIEWLGFDFAVNTYCTLKIFLLSAHNRFYIILSSYVERLVIKNFKSELYVIGWFPGLQNLDFFGKFIVEQVLKSFSGRNNSLKPLVFRVCDSLPYDLEESTELRVLMVKFWV